MKTAALTKIGNFGNAPGYDLTGFASDNTRVGYIVGTDSGIVVSTRFDGPLFKAGVYVNFDAQWFKYTGPVDLAAIALKRCNDALLTLDGLDVNGMDEDDLVEAVEATRFWDIPNY